MESLPSPTLWAIPLFVATVALEWAWSRRNARIRYDTKDAFQSMALGVGSAVAGIATAGAVLAVGAWVYEHRLFDFSIDRSNGWWLIPVAFVAADFCYYWFHRAAHRVRWFWAAHVVHHSSQHYNLTTALRQTWTGFVALSFVFYLPLFLIGFTPTLIVFLVGLNLLYQYWIHTEAIDRMPRWFEAVMNTPSHHRVHHATNPRYLDRNYAGVFIVWDRMFGTFEPETDEEDIRYGIVENLRGHNVIWAAFHEWVGIARDLVRAPWRHKPGYLFRAPGWSHDGSRLGSDALRARWLVDRSQPAHPTDPDTTHLNAKAAT